MESLIHFSLPRQERPVMQKQISRWMAAVLGTLLVSLLAGHASVTAAPLTQGNCDNGRSANAQGELQGDRYVVIWGDTVFSISRRFCISEEALRSANHIKHWDRLYAGTTIVIPKTDSGDGGSNGGTGDGSGDGSCEGDTIIRILAPIADSTVGTNFAVRGDAFVRRNSVAAIRAFDDGNRLLAQRDTFLNWQGPTGDCQGFFDVTLSVQSVPNGTPGYLIATINGASSQRVPVIYGSGAISNCPNPFLTVAAPVAGDRLPATFTVSGQGCLAVASPQVEVRAVNAAGATLTTQVVPLQNGQYSVSLTVNPGFEQSGRIIVTGLGTSVRQDVPVILSSINGGSGTVGSYTDVSNLFCRIVLAGSEPGYYYPTGALFGTMDGGEHRVIARLDLAGVSWYMIEMPFQDRAYTLWAKADDLVNDPAGCF
jgi:LysM repeat protein